MRWRFGGAALVTLLAGGVAAGFAGTAAHADPVSSTALAGVGGDGLQDVFDAYAGAAPTPPSANTVFYTPLHSSSATNNVTIQSFDAYPAGGSVAAPGCITTKSGGPAFDRPSSSGNGTTALAAAVNGTNWVQSTASCTGTGVNVTGQLDWVRSASQPKTSGSTLTWIPFARDATVFAYFDHGTNTIQHLTTAQLTALYSSSSGTLTIAGDTVEACLPLAGSAVRKNAEAAIGVTDSQANTAANAVSCNNLDQNGGNTFYNTVSSLPSGTDAVFPFTAASWIAQANHTAEDRSNTARANGVDLASIDSLGKPYTGTSPNLDGNDNYYTSSTYGNNVYVVVPTNKISGFTKNAALVSLFSGSTSQICSAAANATANTFGFNDLTAGEGTCGSTTLTGNS
ncbi:MAG TPA: hypothetical protein VGO03_12415 [Acidimicrobiia bacterium]|jgi:hypothetical protein